MATADGASPMLKYQLKSAQQKCISINQVNLTAYTIR
jgi:hypothetical protein